MLTSCLGEIAPTHHLEIGALKYLIHLLFQDFRKSHGRYPLRFLDSTYFRNEISRLFLISPGETISGNWVKLSSVSPAGRYWLWCAVDQGGYVLDEIIQNRRNT